MNKIPTEKINEWIRNYHDLVNDNPELVASEQLTEQMYLVHCGALWGYTEGIIAVQSICKLDFPDAIETQNMATNVPAP